MKITIEFDNQEDAEMALNGHLWSTCVHEMNSYFRLTTKYGESINGGEASAIEIDLAEKYRAKLLEIVSDRCLYL